MSFSWWKSWCLLDRKDSNFIGSCPAVGSTAFILTTVSLFIDWWIYNECGKPNISVSFIRYITMYIIYPIIYPNVGNVMFTTRLTEKNGLVNIPLIQNGDVWGVVFIFVLPTLIWLVVWNMFYFSILGIIIPTNFHMFQRDWNHQPVMIINGGSW